MYVYICVCDYEDTHIMCINIFLNVLIHTYKLYINLKCLLIYHLIKIQGPSSLHICSPCPQSK